MKRLICAKEVEACAQQGHKVMYIDADTLITPSAKDAAAVADIEFKVGEPQAECCSAQPCEAAPGTGCARMRSGSSRRNRQRADLQGAQDADG